MEEFKHFSVLLQETIDELHIKPNGIYCDGTLGGGGHSFQIASRLEDGRLIGFDQDQDAIAAATKRLEPVKDRVTIVKSNYEHMVERVHALGIDHVDGIVLDLGVSSYQLDDKERGFSYMQEDAPLDMRMDQESGMTAADILNTYPQEELIRILREYGEEKFASNIARNICQAREKTPFTVAGQLNEVVRASIPKKAQMTGGHPSKRTYQALRIELNRELSVLEESLNGMIDLLGEDGRICIITFHSLEDRIVKNIFKKAEDPCTCPKNFPVCVCGKKSKGKVVTRKPILPSEEELEVNTRSKSAKLRVFERHVN
ncbi:MAG: 16S rRNA (cytosine(1402)-N(4))-methyltransferase RsmH [Lachnospiraceae bacterium]|nr:16S rRNA (cytosine(1402)-N(4))-methyltransferase RsmH [Lachnospiraceae bacterium]